MNTRFNRRDFMKIVVAALGSNIASACGHLLPQTTSTSQPKCNDDALNALSQMVAPEGDRYLGKVPDTLDLQSRAELTINALTRCTSPESNYDVYFYGESRRNPPVMIRRMPFYGKFWEALGLMRHVTGSSFNSQVDERWRELFLEWFRQDNPVLDGPDGGRLLCWISNNYRLERNSCWQQIAEHAIATLSSALVHHGDYCYFTDETGMMDTGWQATHRGWTLQGVTGVYLATGSRIAVSLAAQLARYLKDYAKVFDSNSSFQARHPSDRGPALHFHHNGNTMVAISEYALAAGSEEFAAFAKNGYEFALSIGWPLVGFFPEYINDWPDPRPYIDCETCCTVDMILMAINLSKLGIGDYWDDVDRYVRNQFAEMQMRSGDWINRIAATYPARPVSEGEDGDQIAERVVGSFSGWATANDYIASEGEPFISGCCTGNGARALSYIWDNMIEFASGSLKIHLLLNRASPWVNVDSYIPYEGRVDLKIKRITHLEVRIPEWVRPQEVRCTVDGTTTGVAFRGRYAVLDQLETGNLVTLTFPIMERTVKATIGNAAFTLVIKGNEVVSIDPPGNWQPFYQRTHYRENVVRWVEYQRFVAG